MRKSITSKDIRKPAIVARLKWMSGGNKVTQVMEDDTHYRAQCFRYAGGKYEDLGTFSFNKEELQLKPLDAAIKKAGY